MNGLTGAAAKAEAGRLGEIYDCSWQHIYGMTSDLRQGLRRTRSDAGKRKFDIVEGTDTFEAASLVLGAKLDPDQALLTAKANGHINVPTLATLQKLLRERQLNGKQRRTGRRNHRRFEAAAPLDMVQIDCTALKVRWKDIKTRRIMRIEGVDKNHPMLDNQMVRVWQILAVDDHSRRMFLRYVACGHITSRDMVIFCCQLIKEWGLPRVFYTDNGPEFKAFFAKAVKILGSIPAIAETGGCEHLKHMPNNPQASGKVEVGHKWTEKMDRYIGLADSRGIEVTVDSLDGFADAICRHNNEVKVHRTTGETPMARWHGTQVLKRMLPAEVITAALLFDEAERRLTETMTVRVDKLDYRIPARDAAGNASPFMVGMKLRVVVPHELEQIFVTLPNGQEYDIDKVVATADVAGEWKSAAPSEAEVLTKQLKAHHAAKNKEAKELKKTTGEVYQVPHFNHEIAVPDTNVRHFPHPEIAVTAAELGEVVPVPVTEYVGKPVTYWEAVAEYQDSFAAKDEAKQFLLGLFPDKTGELPSTEVAAAINGRNDKPAAQLLRAVS